MNVHDSEKMSGIFAESGCSQSDDINKADVIVLNTCSIREKAEQKFYSKLGRLRKIKENRPELKIAVAGCIAQQKGDALFKSFPYVDFVFGPNNIDNLQNWIKDRSRITENRAQTTGLHTEISNNGSHITALQDNPDYHNMILPIKREGQVRAWVSIMYGCDNYCAYCVVPYTRGRERSRPVNDIYHEVMSLADWGCREITLLGQNVNSYGRKSSNNIDFTELLVKLHEVKGIERIRFVTSHPRDFSEKLIGAIKDLPKVCEHLHLPIQSGSDRVLELMNRGYTGKEYREKIDLLRQAVPEIAITTDIIVGFPGEREEDFQDTLNAMSDIGYDGIFAFKYSKRPHTKALALDGHIDDKIKSERLSTVLALQEDITHRKNKGHEGSIVEVLVEGLSENNPERLTGRTRTNKIVNFHGIETCTGNLLNIRVLEAKQHSLYGEKA